MAWIRLDTHLQPEGLPMRKTLVALALTTAIVAPQPAFAKEPGADNGMAELAERLGDPAEQDRVAATVHVLGEVLLGLPVGQMANALAEAAGDEDFQADPRATLGELAGPGSRQVPAKVAERVPQMMGMLAGLVEGMEAMRPALADLSKTLRERASLPDGNRLAR